MKYLFTLLLLASTTVYGQLTLDSAKIIAGGYRLGSYSYHEQFIGHAGYGAPFILTSDGGAAFFGDNSDSLGGFAQLIKVDAKGKEAWKKTIRPQFNELESQSVVQDKNGNFYVFMLSYDEKRYRGGSQRVICYNKSGNLLWDKTIGPYTLMNNPVISYIKMLQDGRIALRGHIVTDKPVEGKDPKYRYWEGWMNNKGVLTQKAGDVIDWSNQEWQKLFKPE